MGYTIVCCIDVFLMMQMDVLMSCTCSEVCENGTQVYNGFGDLRHNVFSL